MRWPHFQFVALLMSFFLTLRYPAVNGEWGEITVFAFVNPLLLLPKTIKFAADRGGFGSCGLSRTSIRAPKWPRLDATFLALLICRFEMA